MVVDSNNCADSIVLSIVDWNYHTTSISYSTTSNDFITNSVINFEETNDGSSVAWYWDFGDSTFSTLTNPDHSFSYIGNYTICLIANNQFNCFDTACIDLEILPEPIVIPNVITPNSGELGETLTVFISGSQNDFGAWSNSYNMFLAIDDEMMGGWPSYQISIQNLN